MLILSFVSHWVHNVEGNILASLEEEPPEMPLTGARMEQANLLESRMRHVGFLSIRNNLRGILKLKFVEPVSPTQSLLMPWYN